MAELPRPAHVWDDLVPGHLPHRYGSDSVVFARRLLHNGGAVEPSTVALHELDATKALLAHRLQRLTRRLSESRDWARYLAEIERISRERKLNVLHGHFGTTAARLVPLADRTGLPLVASFYGVDASAVLRQQRWQQPYQALFGRAALLVVLCEAVRDRLVHAGAPADRVVVWNMPAGVERHPIRARARTDEVRFLIAARFVAKKGYFVLLDAFERFLATGRRGSLTMIGYGPQAHAVVDTAKQRGIADRCVVIDTALSADFHQTFDDALTSSDVFLMPSITASDGDDEGGPALTMVCAQASGLPVICTPFPGAERSLVDNVTGLLCSESDPASLAERMADLADDLETADRMGRAGSELVHREFSAAGQQGAMLALYEGLEPRP